MNNIICGDTLITLKTFEPESIDCVITSPPYWALRDYGVEGQLGLEPTFQEYITKLCNIFDEVKRVLKKTGTCWVNMGDTFFGGGNNRGRNFDETLSDKQRTNRGTAYENATTNFDWGNYYSDKCLCQIPSRFSIEMVNRGWILRNTIIWHKPNCMPSSVKDRFTVDFEYLFFFVKNKKYWFETQYELLANATIERSKCGTWRSKKESKLGKKVLPMDYNSFNKAIQKMVELGKRNKRTVWSIPPTRFKDTHFAVFPKALVKTPILAGCPQGGVVLDPFSGSGTTSIVAKELNRQYIGIDLNPKYCEMAEKRLMNTMGVLV